MKKIMTAALACIMTFALAIGTIEIIGMMGSSAVTVQAIGSGGESSGGSSGSSSSSSSSSSSGSSAKKAKKKAAPKKKLSVSGNVVTLDSTVLQSSNVTLPKSQIMNIQNAGGKKTYKIKKVSGGSKKLFKISKKGKLTIKKGIAPGVYTVKVKVTTKGNKKCKAGSKVATISIVVAEPAPPAPAPEPAPAPQQDPASN